MHASLASLSPAPRLPATEPPHRRCFRPRQPVSDALLPGEGLPLSITTLHERLSLLAKLELPCTIAITNPALHLRRALIRAVELADGNLGIGGDGFHLRLRGDSIQSIYLSDIPNGGSLDIYQPHGLLYASIRPAPDGVGGAVWRDVMDNPSLSLF